MNRFWLVTGSVCMLLALAIAAASGHATPGEFVPTGRQVLDTARELHIVHALALLLLGVLSPDVGNAKLKALAGTAFVAGILLFPGGIYASRLLGIEAVRLLIPAGGISFMLGWLLLAVAVLRQPASRP